MGMAPRKLRAPVTENVGPVAAQVTSQYRDRQRKRQKPQQNRESEVDSPRRGCHLRTVMAVRPILRFPDSRLRQTSVEVEAVDDDVRRLVADMTDSMYAANGAGLAAIQVGSPLRLFIVDSGVAGGG